MSTRFFDHIDLRVRNMAAAEEFYGRWLPELGFTAEASDGAESRAQVDRLAGFVRQAGGRHLEGPALCPEYSPGYYALFSQDPSGNKLEICCRERRAA